MTRPGITAPIASATKLEQLQELVNATKLQLDQASIDRLNKASEEGDQENA
jgi:aryl-alcohol dehydrogenase-like predicted oxidoreductase